MDVDNKPLRLAVRVTEVNRHSHVDNIVGPLSF